MEPLQMKIADTVTGQSLASVNLAGGVLCLNDPQESQRAIDEYRHLAHRSSELAALQAHSFSENYQAGRLALICNLAITVPFDSVWMRCFPHNGQPAREVELLASIIYR